MDFVWPETSSLFFACGQWMLCGQRVLLCFYVWPEFFYVFASSEIRADLLQVDFVWPESSSLFLRVANGFCVASKFFSVFTCGPLVLPHDDGHWQLPALL